MPVGKDGSPNSSGENETVLGRRVRAMLRRDHLQEGDTGFLQALAGMPLREQLELLVGHVVSATVKPGRVEELLDDGSLIYQVNSLNASQKTRVVALAGQIGFEVTDIAESAEERKPSVLGITWDRRDYSVTFKHNGHFQLGTGEEV